MKSKIILIILQIVSIIYLSIALVDVIKAYREHKVHLKAIVLGLFCIIVNLMVIGISIHQIYLILQ